MDLAEYNKVKNYSYHEYCNYLIDKYGRVFGAYFTPSGYKNKVITRTRDGLYIHHIYEDHAIMLGDINYARNNPYEWQLGRNLVYCDILEHMFLHILISENPPEDKNPKEDVGVGGVANFIVPELNDLYSGWITKQDWRLKCHLKAIGSKDLYFILVKRFDDAFKKHPTYKSRWYVSSMNAQMNPSGDWKLSDNKELINDIANLLGESEQLRNNQTANGSDTKEMKINIDDIDFGDFKNFTKTELNKIHNYINVKYDNDDCTMKLIESLKDLSKCFETMIESEIAELTNVLVIHVLENHMESPALYSLALSLIKQIVVHNMYKSGEFGEGDILLYLCECNGYYSTKIQESLQKHLGNDIHFYIDKGLAFFNEEFSNLSLKAFKIPSEDFPSSEFKWILDDPCFIAADYNDDDKWDDLCSTYFSSLPKGLNLYSFLRDLENPFTTYPNDKRVIDNTMHYIINKLIYEAVKSLDIEDEANNFEEGPKRYYTVLKKEDYMGVFDRIQLSQKDVNSIADFFASSSDSLHKQILIDIYAIYKSIYLCHEMGACSVSIQLYPVFCNWIITFYNFDIKSLSESKKELQFFDESSCFLKHMDLYPASDDKILDAYCRRFTTYAANYYEKHYSEDSNIAKVEDFFNIVIETMGYPSSYYDVCSRNAYNYFVIHAEDSYYDVCLGTYEIAKYTKGMNISVSLTPQINFQDLSLYLSLNTLESINMIFRDYMENLARYMKNKEGKELINNCVSELKYAYQEYHNHGVSVYWTFRKEKPKNN